MGTGPQDRSASMQEQEWGELEPHVVIYYLFSGPEYGGPGMFTAA